MTTRWWHIIALLAIGVAIGWYYRPLGTATLGKLGVSPVG